MVSNSIYAARRPRLVIADHHILIAQACKRLLEPEFEVVGIVPNGRELVDSLEMFQPDVVILEICMPLLNGLDAGDRIKAIKRNTKLVYVTMSSRPDVAAEAFRRCASGYVLKQGNAEEMRIAVRTVLRGQSYLSRLLDREQVEMYIRLGCQVEANKRLSTRRREVLRLIAEGRSMKEIAKILKITYGTVAFHKYKTMEFLGINNTARLVQYAVTHHLVSNTPTRAPFL
jgi:DNA-binding NarL/FixJ family response regulator